MSTYIYCINVNTLTWLVIHAVSIIMYLPLIRNQSNVNSLEWQYRFKGDGNKISFFAKFFFLYVHSLFWDWGFFLVKKKLWLILSDHNLIYHQSQLCTRRQLCTRKIICLWLIEGLAINLDQCKSFIYKSVYYYCS